MMVLPRLGRGALIPLGLLLCALVSIQSASAQLMVRLAGTNVTFDNPNNISVGLASDLVLEVECFAGTGTQDGTDDMSGSGTTGESGTTSGSGALTVDENQTMNGTDTMTMNGTETVNQTFTWAYRNGNEIPSGLQAFGVSQGGGVLRVFPVQLLSDGSEFVCRSDQDNNSTLNVTFDLADDLFFTSDTQLTIPDVPVGVSRLISEGGLYRLVETERGVYRSANTIVTPSFRANLTPADITVQPTSNNFSTGAFVCSVSNPSNLPLDIQWFYRNTSDADPTLLNASDSQVTILDSNSGLVDTGTSILILESVTDANEGSYFCRVEYCCGAVTSVEGELTFVNETISGPRRILPVLPPGASLVSYSVPAGSNFTIPCVVSDLSLPEFVVGLADPVPSEQVTIGGVNIVNFVPPQGPININNIYECIVGADRLVSTLNEEAPMAPPTVTTTPDTPELVVVEGEEVQLSCNTDPAETGAEILVNNTATGSETLNITAAVRNDSGFYQCVTSDELTVDSVYLLVAYAETPQIISSTQSITLGVDSDLTLSCTSLANPPPRLTWSIVPSRTELVDPFQLPTGRMETASSSVSVNLDTLAVDDYTVTCTSEVDSVDNPALISVSATFDFSVDVIFENVSIESSADNVTVGLTEANIVLTCSVVSSVQPSFTFSQNSNSLGEFAGVLSNDSNITNLYSFSLTVSNLVFGMSVFECSASLGIGNVAPLTASTVVNVDAFFENISVAASTRNVVVRRMEPEIITVTCSVFSIPTPMFSFYLNGVSVPGRFAAVLDNATTGSYSAVHEFSSDELDLGNDTFFCTATLSRVGVTLTSDNITIEVSVLFENLTLEVTTPEGEEGEGLVVVPHDDPQPFTLTCTLQSSVEPIVVWRRNGNVTEDGVTPPTLLSEGTNLTYVSTLSLNDSELVPPVENFSCSASPNISGPVELVPVLSDMVSVEIQFVLENISVSLDGAEFSTVRIPEENGNESMESGNGTDDVDEGLSMGQNGNETEVTLTCTMLASMLPQVTWTQDGNPVNGTAPRRVDREGLEVVSEFTVNRTEVMGVVEFNCTAFLDGASISATSTVTFNVSPLFVTSPLNFTLVVEGDSVTLTCSADGFPAPSITWESEDGTNLSSDNATFEIITNTTSFLSSSYLTFVTSGDDNRTDSESGFRCVAANSVLNRTESELGQIIFAGPPGPPGNFSAVNTTSDSTVLVWAAPVSDVPLTNYTLDIVQIQSLSSLDFTAVSGLLIAADQLSVEIRPPFRPDSLYSAELTANSRAGAGSAVAVIRTPEAAPGGPPLNVLTSAPARGEIAVAWAPPAPGLQNGDLTGFTVRYQNQDPGINMMEFVDVNTRTRTLQGLADGVSYSIQVAAHTGAGMGNFSDPILQSTIPIPPEVPQVGFRRDPAGEATTATIPIILPDIADLTLYSHFWVVAMKVAADDQLTENPATRFPNNNSFVTYTSVIEPNQPYIVAEISSSRYEVARNFLLGSLNTQMFNDQPGLYFNGPLNQSTSYTVFVWGFSPTPAASVSRAKRQDVSPPPQPLRQYTVFTSTLFLAPVSTAGGGIDGGAIAGIVIAVIILVLLLIAVIIAGVLLYDRLRYSADIAPPPTRKGSMRLVNQNEVNHNVTRRNSLRSSFRAITTLRNQKAEAELQDLNPDDARLPVSVEEFPSYTKSMHKNTDHLFSEEYEILSIKSPSLTHVQSSLPGNIQKNRYANINCYDGTRVTLATDKEVHTSDYINANFIDGYRSKNAYIATQGPLANTAHDFWRMIWERDSCCIIMLTNLVEKSRVKCHQYWPEVGSINMGDLSILLIEVQELAYYTIRTFRLTKHNTTREVKQFHYTGWPDFGVPDYPHPVMAFIRRLARYKRTTSGPDIVHCSAGVGRTGTLVAMQAMMEMVKREEKADIFNFVLGMRQQRNYMVQTERQYIFIHDALLENITMGDTEVSIQRLRGHFKKLSEHNPRLDCSPMEKEYMHLNEIQVIDDTQYQPALHTVNRPKNRFLNILPYDRYRVRLLLHPGVQGSDYINACYVDGYQRRHQYILTQGPMSNTVTDFWRMVWEHRCSCIMMLCQLEERGEEQSVCYWPSEKVRQHGDMFVEQTSVSEMPNYTVREFAITNTKINESRVIKHYQYSEWLENEAPANAAAVIDLIGLLQKTQHMCGGGPIVVHDNTSIGRAGTFVVLSSILEQVKVEGVVDPFSTIHCLRQQQPGIVSTFEQYKFCYQAVMEFLDSFDHYANFD